MSALIPKITSVGMQKIFNASNTGLQAVVKEIAFGDANGGGYTPNGNETSLVNEIIRVPIGGGEKLSNYEIEMQALLDTGPSFWIQEIGFILEDGTLLALWSDESKALAYKTQGVDLVVAYNLALQDIPPNSITLVTTGPQVNITMTDFVASTTAQIIRLQRRAVESEIARLTPIIETTWS